MPAFALDLDHDGIRLLRRAEDDWLTMDQVALDDPALPRRLREMRIAAELQSEGALETELIIPPTQILYTQIPTPQGLSKIRDEDIVEGLEGLTPCPVSELVFDWRREGDVIVVAALDVNTLDEAENFATTYGFNPVRFIARPGPEDFPDVPDFGPTQFADHQPLKATFIPAHRAGIEPVRDVPEPEPEIDVAPEVTVEPEVVAQPDVAVEEPVVETEALAEPQTEVEAEDVVVEEAEVFAEAEVEPDEISEPESVAAEIPEPAFVPIPERAREPIPEIGPAVRVAEPRPIPVRLANRRSEPLPPPAKRSVAGTLTTAAGALMTFALLVWTALYLVTPKVDTRLPEVAATPTPGAETDEVPEARSTPSRTAPVLVTDAPLPTLPGLDQDVDPTDVMVARSDLGLLAPRAPDPTTEVGVLKSADVWQRPPVALIEPVENLLDELYLASIDPLVTVDDAFALATPSADDDPLSEPPIPPAAGDVFDLDPQGLVQATPEGALSPDGILVTAGPPPKRPPQRPAFAETATDAAVALALANKLPRERPDDLIERNERTQLGGRTREELAGIRPRPRPASAQNEATNAATEDGLDNPSPLAVAVSRAPSYRPNDFAVIVAAQQAARGIAPAADAPVVTTASASAVAPVQPRIPSSASVARQATLESAINLRRLNLIGVYGSESDRRALIRLPSGRYVKVKVGDRIDGGQIGSIGDNQLRYIKGGRNLTLTVPSG